MRTAFRRLGVITLSLALTVALLGLVVLPIAAATLGPTLLRSAGLVSDNLTLRLATGPALLIGRVDALSMQSGPLQVEDRFAAAEARIALGHVSLVDRTFDSLDLAGDDLTATLASGEVVHAQSLTAWGPASNVTTTVRFSLSDLQAMLAYPSTGERLGFHPTGLRLSEGSAILETETGSVEVRLVVDAAGNLILRQDKAADRILWAAMGEDARDWSLTSVLLQADGVTVTAHFDVAAFLSRYPSI